MVNITTVLFDLDGVLIDTCKLHEKAFINTILSIDDKSLRINDKFYSIIDTNISELYTHELKRFYDNPTKYHETLEALPTKNKLSMLNIDELFIDDLFKIKQEFTMQYLKELPVNDIFKKELIKELKKRKMKIGIVTNAIYPTTKYLLEEKLNISLEVFDNVMTNEYSRKPKPSAEPYINTMINLKSYPKETLVIEDSIKGIKSALKACVFVMKVKNATEVNTKTVFNKLYNLTQNRQFIIK